MKTYICKEQFEVDMVDDNEFEIDSKMMLIEKDSLWNLCEKSYVSDLRLENENGSYLEITKDKLELYFDKL